MKKQFWKIPAAAVFAIVLALGVTACPNNGGGEDIPDPPITGPGHEISGANRENLTLRGQVYVLDIVGGDVETYDGTHTDIFTSFETKGTGGIVEGQLNFTPNPITATDMRDLYLQLLGDVTVSPAGARAVVLDALLAVGGEDFSEVLRWNLDVADRFTMSMEFVSFVYVTEPVSVTREEQEIAEFELPVDIGAAGLGITLKAYDITLQRGWNAITETFTVDLTDVHNLHITHDLTLGDSANTRWIIDLQEGNGGNGGNEIDAPPLPISMPAVIAGTNTPFAGPVDVTEWSVFMITEPYVGTISSGTLNFSANVLNLWDITWGFGWTQAWDFNGELTFDDPNAQHYELDRLEVWNSFDPDDPFAFFGDGEAVLEHANPAIRVQIMYVDRDVTVSWEANAVGGWSAGSMTLLEGWNFVLFQDYVFTVIAPTNTAGLAPLRWAVDL